MPYEIVAEKIAKISPEYQGEELLRFSVYLIHVLAEEWKISPSQAYEVLNVTNVLDNYIIPCFDVLHSMGREALVEDMTSFVREKGFAV